ncbi:alpha/beta hydrolase [Pelagicoccus mobilis]|uniref:Esterase family protein n=1 Tax=Pelagicoccus mobilis TaxID=415221 RepID=A0A934VJ63_9BACT|nr:alpha/beta hydrolase-fold protein [Pelagicoccus mobilis]MBK1875271.1 esterase family protein [Pelagicoccus mobilis]
MTSYFRTTETGDFPCPNGTLRFHTVKSPALRARADASLYIPKQAEGKTNVPVVTLLHGVYGSHWVWASMGKAHIGLQTMIDAGEIPPMILAMPSDGLWGCGSGYFEHGGKDFEKWITEDIRHLVSESTGNSIEAPHFIAGLSMGGFGAMRLGARNPDRYLAFSGHSSVTRLEELPKHFVEEPLEAYGQSPNTDISIQNSILENKATLRPFRFDCGVDDELIEYNRTLAAALKAENIDFSYEEFPGGHEWPYWEEHVRKTYAFFASVL